MTTLATPVPVQVLLTRHIRLAKVAAERADAHLVQAKDEHAAAYRTLAALEAEYRTVRVEHVA